MERVQEMTSLVPSCQLLSLSPCWSFCWRLRWISSNLQKPQLPVLWILATCMFQVIDATKVLEEKDLIPQGSCRRGTRFLEIWLAKYQHTFFFILFYLLSSWQLHIMFTTCINNRVMVLSSIISDPPSLEIMTATQTLFDIDYIKIQSKKLQEFYIHIKKGQNKNKQKHTLRIFSSLPHRKEKEKENIAPLFFPAIVFTARKILFFFPFHNKNYSQSFSVLFMNKYWQKCQRSLL